jgi:hypothetical protein
VKKQICFFTILDLPNKLQIPEKVLVFTNALVLTLFYRVGQGKDKNLKINKKSKVDFLNQLKLGF